MLSQKVIESIETESLQIEDYFDIKRDYKWKVEINVLKRTVNRRFK